MVDEVKKQLRREAKLNTCLIVYVRSNILSNDVSYCILSWFFNRDNCLQCIKELSCGFCYRQSNSETGFPLNRSICLPIANEIANGSLFGPCVKQSLSVQNETFVWTYRRCPKPPYSNYVILIFCLYIISVTLGILPLPWLVDIELLPRWARSTGVGLCNFFNFFFLLVVTCNFIWFSQDYELYGESNCIRFFWKYMCNVGLLIGYPKSQRYL